jgi:hypothetical protein
MRFLTLIAIAMGIGIIPVRQGKPKQHVIKANGSGNTKKSEVAQQNKQSSETDAIRSLVGEIGEIETAAAPRTS